MPKITPSPPQSRACAPGCVLGAGMPSRCPAGHGALGARVAVCILRASCVLLVFVLVGASNPPGHISELRNFRADTAF